MGEKIGDPVSINADGTPSGPPRVNTKNEPAKKRPADDVANNAPAAKRSPLVNNTNNVAARSSILNSPVVKGHTGGGGDFDPNDATIFPISSLTPYQNKWCIRARVTNKSDIRRWSNSRGEGHLFSMDLLDESGEIRATAFNEQCDKYYNTIEVGKLYYITSCTLKPANKQYSTLKNDYELTFSEASELIPCNDKDTASIPRTQFNFAQLGQITAEHKDETVDVIGI